MATARNHIDKIIEKVTNFHPVDDLAIPEEFILQKMNDVRATLLRQEYRRNNRLDSYYQFSCCHEIKCLNTTCTIGGVTFKADGTIHYVDKPNLIEGIGNKSIGFLGDQDGHEYSQLSLRGFNNMQYLGAPSTLPVYTVVGDKIWIKNPSTSGKLFVCMNKLALDPVHDCDENYDVDYPVPSEYNLELMTMRDILASSGIYVDVKSNEDDDRIVSSQEYLEQQAKEQQQRNEQKSNQ